MTKLIMRNHNEPHGTIHDHSVRLLASFFVWFFLFVWFPYATIWFMFPCLFSVSLMFLRPSILLWAKATATPALCPSASRLRLNLSLPWKTTISLLLSRCQPIGIRRISLTLWFWMLLWTLHRMASVSITVYVPPLT